MTHVSLRIEFSTDKFKITGILPNDANAGNQFFGEDVSQWICEILPLWNLDYIGEDWGWFVFSKKQHSVSERNSICVYAYQQENNSINYVKWIIILDSEYLKPYLKFFTRWRKGQFNKDIASEIIHAIQKLNVQNLIATEVNLDRMGNEKTEAPYSYN